MKSVKTMLLGIALLIVAACGVSLWMAGAVMGAVLFYVGGGAGIALCLKGFFSKE